VIRELRILPPLAIARFGGASTPMDNYDASVNPERPLGYRILRPAETLEVDEATGGIRRSFVPAQVRFKENGLVRPVAPFLEVWALTDDDVLEPLTPDLLAGDQASIGDVRWRVEVANIKVYRRTNRDADKVEASSGDVVDHDAHPLLGTCPNFWPGKSINFGSVRFIRPTDAHPEVRLRFTPAPGFVYGASTTPPPAGAPADPNVREIVYDARPNRGTWLGYSERDSTRPITAPGNIYAGRQVGNNWISRGYLDDGCDGLIRVLVRIGGQTLTAFARIGVGPPTYVPDGLPIRTVADELEQALFGPAVAADEARLEQAEDIVRRAFETVRLMHTPSMNVDGMAFHDFREGRRRDPIMARSLVDTVALEQLHLSLLVALRSGTAPWFADVLRHFDQISDLSDLGRRKMPAMMRGADGRHLALTRRQVAMIQALVRGPVFPEEEADTP
jgi:hypothetical protein